MQAEGWRRVAIRDMGDGKRPAVKAGPFGSALKKSSYSVSGYRVYGQEQVIAGDFSIGDYFIDHEKFMTLRSCEVIPGDLLVSLVGTFGKVVVVPDDAEPGIINPRLLRLAPDRSRVWSPFLRACLCSPAVQKGLSAAAQGGTMGVLNASTIGPIEVALPPLREQRKIAAILSSVDEAIEGTQAVIDQLQVVKKAMMADLLTRGLPGRHKKFKQTEIGEVPEEWEVVPLGSLLNSIDAGWSPQCESRPAWPDEWGVLKVSAVTSGVFLEAEQKALPSTFEPRTSAEVRAGDVLLARANGVLELVGKTVLVRSTRPHLMLSDKLLRLRPDETRLCAPFLTAAMATEAVRSRLLSTTGGSHMRNVSQANLVEVLLPVPPLGEQLAIASALDAMENRAAAEESYLSALSALKSALMSVLLTGEVRVRVEEKSAA